MPPALVETRPPTVQEPSEASDSGNSNPASAAACCTLCKVAPAKADVHMEDVHRTGGIMAILGQLDRAGLIDATQPTVHSATMADALDRWDVSRTNSEEVRPHERSSRARRASSSSRTQTMPPLPAALMTCEP